MEKQKFWRSREAGGLGKDPQGCLEPVIPEEKHDRDGIGFEPSKEDFRVPWSSPPSSQTVFVKAASQLLQEANELGPSPLGKSTEEEEWLLVNQKKEKTEDEVYSLLPLFDPSDEDGARKIKGQALMADESICVLLREEEVEGRESIRRIEVVPRSWQTKPFPGLPKLLLGEPTMSPRLQKTTWVRGPLEEDLPPRLHSFL